jgi:hypothetical protein
MSDGGDDSGMLAERMDSAKPDAKQSQVRAGAAFVSGRLNRDMQLEIFGVLRHIQTFQISKPLPALILAERFHGGDFFIKFFQIALVTA